MNFSQVAILPMGRKRGRNGRRGENGLTARPNQPATVYYLQDELGNPVPVRLINEERTLRI